MAGQGSGKQRALWLHWVARGLGTPVAGFWVFIGILQVIAGSESRTVESTVLAALIIAAAVAVAVGWWREDIGGLLLLIVGAAHGVFAYVAAGHNKLIAVAITGVPFLLLGLLFLASWWLSRRMEMAQN